MKKLYTLSLLIISSIVCYSQPYSITWEKAVGVSVNGSTLTKTAASGWANAGASSRNKLLNYIGGWIEYTVASTSTVFAYGFSEINTDNQFYTIDFGFQLGTSGLTYVRLNGTGVHTFTRSISDVLRVERSGNNMIFKRNGNVIYTANYSITSSMVVDVSVNTNGGIVSGINTSFGIPDEYDVTWGDLVGAEMTDAVTLTKTASAGYSNAGAASLNVLPTKTDGWIEFTLDALNQERAFGFSDVNLNNDYTSIDFGFLTNSGSAFVYENGVNKLTISVVVGDVLRVERIGQAIYWMKNRSVVFLNDDTYTGGLQADAAIKTAGAKIVNARTLFTVPSEQPGVVPLTPEFIALRDFYDSLGGTNWINQHNWPPVSNWPIDMYGASPDGGRTITMIKQNNNVEGIIPSSFWGLHDLWMIWLDRNKIQGFSEMTYADASSIPGLYDINFANNEIASLPQAFGYISNVNYLDLRHNRLKSLPESMGSLTNLVYLGLAYNQLESLPATLGTNSFNLLSQLDMSNNKLTSLPESFGSLGGNSGLTIDLSNNLIFSLPESFGNLGNLTFLYLGNNRIPFLPESFNYLNASTIELANNRLTSLPSDFSEINELTDLDISGNQLTSLPQLNAGLLKLDVSNNYLDFSDLEPLINAGLDSFTYAPQKNIKDITGKVVALGEQLIIPARDPGQHSTITWDKKQPNGTWINVSSLNDDATQETFTINVTEISDIGIYRWKMTNSVITGVTIQSEEIIVKDAVMALLDNYAFRYKYDGRRRMSHKKVPGTEWVYMVYDNRDRLVMTQDGNQRVSNPKEWTFTKYDGLNTPVLTGIYRDTVPEGLDQEQMQEAVNEFYEAVGGPSNTNEWFEEAGTDVHGYTNQSFPAVGSESDYLTAIYYDHYSFRDSIPGGGFNYDTTQLTSADGIYEAQEAEAFDRVTGQITGTKVKNLETNAWYYTTSYYDDRYRVIQSIMQNHKGGIDKITNVYDFAGRVTRTKTSHSLSTGPAYAITRKFVYDHAGRLLETHHKTDTADYVVLAENQYNELGQVITKKLHSENNGTSFKQHEDYRYNIRGWLTRINNSSLSNVDEGPSDYFGMEFGYNNSLNIGTLRPQYNGKISATKWSTALGLGFNDEELEISEAVERGYTFTYDSLDRLLAADHVEKTTLWEPSNSFHENNLSYDLNGNITSLDRTGVNGSDIDLLAYTYVGNQLQKVDDDGTDDEGFKDGTNTDNDYIYDSNGNMIVDKNKGIEAIHYSHLNLPDTIIKANGEYITYAYDATGRKLSQRVFNGSGTLQKETDYLGEFYYENDTLQFVNHEEGRLVMTGSQPEYQYHLKDHLGNVRMTFTTKPLVDQYLATMEDASWEEERADFLNYEYVPTSVVLMYNHTEEVNATRSVVLNGAVGKQVGLTKSLRVTPGDTIDLEVYAKYYAPAQTEAVGTFIASAMTGAFGLSSGSSGLEYSAYQSLNGMFDEGWVLGADDWEDADAPKAFLNYILFDEDFMPYDMGWDQISEDAGVTPQNPNPDHDTLSLQAVARKPGYIYIYFSNEEQEDIIEVYFDDLNIKHRHSPVVQADDYYPFGLTFNSYQRENSVDQKYLYNGKELQDELQLGWFDYGARMLDPSLGRWFVVDNLADHPKQNSWTPYHYVKNNPVNSTDPDGNCGDCFLDLAFMLYDVAEIAYDYAATGEVNPVSVAALSADAVALIIPGVTGAGVAVRIGKEGGEQAVKQLAKGGAEQGAKKIDQAALARGRKNETKTLAQEGLEKNTKTMTATDPKTGKTVNTIPDAVKNDGGTIEVKDRKVVSDSRQLRAQTEVSSQSGQKATVITGTNTKVSQTVNKRMTVIRRDNIGPQ